MDLYLIIFAIGVTIAAMFTPPGMALAATAFALLRDSKLVRWLTVGLAVVFAIAAMRWDARKKGKAEALRDVEAANRKAQDRRVQIDRKTESDAEQTIRDELKRWSR